MSDTLYDYTWINNQNIPGLSTCVTNLTPNETFAVKLKYITKTHIAGTSLTPTDYTYELESTTASFGYKPNYMKAYELYDIITQIHTLGNIHNENWFGLGVSVMGKGYYTALLDQYNKVPLDDPAKQQFESAITEYSSNVTRLKYFMAKHYLLSMCYCNNGGAGADIKPIFDMCAQSLFIGGYNCTLGDTDTGTGTGKGTGTGTDKGKPPQYVNYPRLCIVMIYGFGPTYNRHITAHPNAIKSAFARFTAGRAPHVSDIFTYSGAMTPEYATYCVNRLLKTPLPGNRMLRDLYNSATDLGRSRIMQSIANDSPKYGQDPNKNYPRASYSGAMVIDSAKLPSQCRTKSQSFVFQTMKYDTDAKYGSLLRDESDIYT